ncbi:hypothetical protein [Endozoicomonas euniceicola]|uniref:PH domain-containing protein n=1 Tax=Endozoicomonas euniceicola TaxID=1234143 RepID=A0ABY6GQ60_9GAMM|nr:hypothetical protein [Endozoicomonas euniceicola]UYM14291.1 hypothetical protein NX720_15440 [Endozoicomonas euniceicola]
MTPIDELLVQSGESESIVELALEKYPEFTREDWLKALRMARGGRSVLTTAKVVAGHKSKADIEIKK